MNTDQGSEEVSLEETFLLLLFPLVHRHFLGTRGCKLVEGNIGDHLWQRDKKKPSWRSELITALSVKCNHFRAFLFICGSAFQH